MKFNNIAKLLKTARKREGLNQAQLAGLVFNNDEHVKQMRISNIERGKSGLPVKHVTAFCEALNITLPEIEHAMTMDLKAHVRKHVYHDKDCIRCNKPYKTPELYSKMCHECRRLSPEEKRRELLVSAKPNICPYCKGEYINKGKHLNGCWDYRELLGKRVNIQ